MLLLESSLQAILAALGERMSTQSENMRVRGWQLAPLLQMSQISSPMPITARCAQSESRGHNLLGRQWRNSGQQKLAVGEARVLYWPQWD